MTNHTMQAVRIHDYGGPEQLTLEQAPRPEPKAGEVLVRVRSAGVNRADWAFCAGLFKAFVPLAMPWTPGLEAAGVVEAVGPEVTGLKPGQAVYGMASGSYAEYTAVPAGSLSAKPSGLTFDQAAAVPMGALAAWQMVIETAKVQPGQRVLVHGAAGGIGSYVVQLARWRGAHVIGTTSAANVEFVRSLGAQQVIDYEQEAFEKTVRDVDAVLDTVGDPVIEGSWQVLRPGGILVSIAARLAPEQGEAHGVRAVSVRPAPAEKLAQVTELIEAGKVVPTVGPVFALAQARQAQERVQTGHGRGRIVLHIADQ